MVTPRLRNSLRPGSVPDWPESVGRRKSPTRSRSCSTTNTRIVAAMRFRTTLRLAGKTATGFEVPAEVVESFGAGKRPPVTVTINGYTYRSTVAVYGGAFMIGVAAEHRGKAGIAAGEDIEVDVELDTAPRSVEVPADLAEAFAADPGARQAFDKLSYTHQREHVEAIESAKKPETRQRRIDKALAMLRGD